MPPKKEQNPTPPKESGEKHSRFDLVPLDAPRLSHKRYEGKGGYQDYLSDYKMYRAALIEYRLEGTLQRQQKVVVKVDPEKAGAASLSWEIRQVPGNQIPPYKPDFGMVDSTGRETSTINAGEFPRVFWRRDKKSMRTFGKPAELLNVGDKLQVPFIGFQSTQQMAEITITGATVVGKVEATFAEKVKKPRGPAVTPKKSADTRRNFRACCQGEGAQGKPQMAEGARGDALQGETRGAARQERRCPRRCHQEGRRFCRD